MHAMIIGATGATGMPLTQLLLNHSAFDKITVFVRKPLDLSHPKLSIEIIDFDSPHTWQNKVTGDVLFSCLGTTLKQAGSKDAQYKIDYTYQYNFAKIAKQNGVKHYVLISSDMANAHAKTFYSRIKGELDNAVIALNFEKLSIFRPPLLIRKNSDRFGEKFAEKLILALNKIGLLKSHKPLPTPLLAQAMITAVTNNKTDILDKHTIWQLLNEYKG